MSEPPEISISLSLSPNPYSYSSTDPPTLSLTATSHAATPLTVLTYHTILHPNLALRQSAFQIRDLTTSAPIPQHTVQLSRLAFQRRLGSPDEQFFLTLFPEQPVTVSTEFGYPVSSGPPLPKGHSGRTREAAKGKVDRGVLGVDGLESGREYELSVVRGLDVTWWRWGTKEELLEPEGGGGSAQLGTSEEGFELADWKGIEPVVFQVVE